MIVPSFASSIRVAVLGLAIGASAVTRCGSGAEASAAQVHLRGISQHQLRAMCLRLLRPPRAGMSGASGRCTPSTTTPW